jgi:hypothetical protein
VINKSFTELLSVEAAGRLLAGNLPVIIFQSLEDLLEEWMSSSYWHLTVESDAPTLLSLLERGLHYAQQGFYIEAAACFIQAREQLAPHQVQLAGALDAFVQSHLHYRQAQQMLHEASKHFAEADAQQQAQITLLEKLVPSLLTKADSASQPTIEGSRSIHLLQPSTSDPPVLQKTPKEGNALPALYITCFGHFELRRLGQPITLCSNRNGQAVLRYLIAQPKHSATMDTLMAVLWPEETAEVARHKLRVAMSALRCSLNSEYTSEAGGG